MELIFKKSDTSYFSMIYFIKLLQKTNTNYSITNVDRYVIIEF
jgi:hypothetical protein